MTTYFSFTPSGVKSVLRLRGALLSLLLLSIVYSYSSSLGAQCTFEGQAGMLLVRDYDDDQGPYQVTYGLPAVFGQAFVTATSDADIEICFYGDMAGGQETFDVVIEGQTFASGGFGSTPTSASPQCRTFTISMVSLANGLSDGDLDITYNNFGSGWTSNAITGGADDFNAYVNSVSFEYEFAVTINMVGNQCQDGTDITFSGTPADGTVAGDAVTYTISPSTAAFDATTGVLDVSAAAAGVYVVSRTYSLNGCSAGTDTDVTVFAAPVATIDDAVNACNVTGINLTDLFTGATTPGGTFTSTTTGATINGNFLTYDGFGCVDVTYTLANDNGCLNGPYTDEATVFFPEQAQPNFQVTSTTTCWDGSAPLPIVIDRTSPDYTGTPAITWSATATGVNVTITNTTSDVPSISLSRIDPAVPDIGRVRICLEETLTTPGGACATDQDCSASRCRELTVSSYGCNEECTLFDPPADVCPIEVNSSFGFSVFGINFDFGSLSGFDLYEASVVPGEYVQQNNPSLGGTEDALISCTEDGIDVSWDAGLNDALFPQSPLLDQPIREQVGAGFLCDAAMFSIPFPSGFCGDCGPRGSPNICADLGLFDPCILIDELMPLGFLDFEIDGFGSICSITPRTLIVDPLQQVIESSSVAVVWADTDGDGAFDHVLEQGSMIGDGSAAGMAFVPNNVQGEGIITVRIVAAAIKSPYSPCVSPEGTDLLELLPIDFIPVAGPIIRQVLTTAGVNINIAPSDYEDLPIVVQNDQDPQFLNFPTEYVFSTGSECSTPVNWSAPIAIDGCTGIVIENVSQTGGPMPGDVLEVPNPNPVDPNNPNLYQVEYTATACNGQTLVQTFDVIVSAGEPQLVCPGDFVLPNDVDQCSRVVTGLTPLQGLGCNNTVTWEAPGASPSAGVNDASGTTFPVGTTTVTYTLTYVDGNGVTQSETCDFDVTITDTQKPTAQCRDFEVQLDASGQATVTIADIEGGSTDNCTPTAGLDFSIARTDMVFGETVTFDCYEEGQQTVILRVRDAAESDGNPATDDRNERRCLALVTVKDYFEDFTLTLDVPELCLETNNQEQLNFGNYLSIAYPNGNVLSLVEELTNGDDVGGVFGITGYMPSVPGSGTTRGTSPDNPGDAGYINPLTGEYTPGTGSGFVTISYVLGIDGQVAAGTNNLEGCFVLTTDVFELRQPLAMDSPECACIVQNDRIVELGEVTGGLEPYTIQYSGVKLDVDNDGIADDLDGEFVFVGDFSGSAGAMTFDTSDFAQDLGSLLVDYTQPTWSFTVVDARGCELFRSGSCDNEDLNGTPEIICEDLGPVYLFTSELSCDAQYTWDHPLPTDNCDVILYTYSITNPDGSIAGPFDLTPLLNPSITNPTPDFFQGSYAFRHVNSMLTRSVVTYYAEDAVGNFTSCSFEVNVTDNVAPVFTNCPEPAVIIDAIEGRCEAYANYSLPLAVDNCSVPTVEQVDDTGLISGDLYPVGITINTFEATDESGNTTRCDVKVIVNDIMLPPPFSCPGDQVVSTDPGDCGAVVDDIAPAGIQDNCIDNVTVLYRIDDENGEFVSSGFDDASGLLFPEGLSTVSYAVQDVPLLLITEITHDISNAIDGNELIPPYAAGNPATGDYLEITNFNRAVLDVSCLTVERYTAAGTETFAVPTFTLLAPGETLVIHFGDGTDSQADNFFNVPGAANLDADEPAAYVISLSRSILDVAVINGFDLTGTAAAAYWSGSISPTDGAGIIRTTVWDTDTAADFVAGEACQKSTIGALNPSLPQPVANGGSTAIQAQVPERVTCTPFTITVVDNEPAVCGLYGDYIDIAGAPAVVEVGECTEIVFSVTDDFNLADANLSISGTAGDLGNLTFTLISPEGTEVVLAAEVCPGTNAIDFTFDDDFGPAVGDACAVLNAGDQPVIPGEALANFNGELVAGDWVLEIGHNGRLSTAPASIATATLSLSARLAYPDYAATLENDFGLCEAEYTWQHPILFDNCLDGSVNLVIVGPYGDTLVNEDLGVLAENTEVTFSFPVGTNTVIYTLIDGSGNDSNCGFEVIVNDTENPVITCPSDTTIQLAGGECDVVYLPTDYTAMDNCGVESIVGNPPFDQPLPIGMNTVAFTVTDSSGNDTTCTYVVNVLEYIPMPAQMVCYAEINIHLPADCEKEIIPELVLAGNEYYCFDTYELTLLQRNAEGTFDTLPTNFVGVDQIGAELRYSIYDPRNDIGCWGRLEVGFFEAPVFICPADTVVSCNAATDTSALGAPILQSCALAGATVSFTDDLQRNEACDDPRAVLRRTWLVADSYGNSDTCIQTVIIEAFDLDVVQFPADIDGVIVPAINCADAANDPSLTDPENTGFPTVADGANIFTTNFCSASFLYTDEVYDICAGSYEILRTWKVRNTCLPVIPGVNPIESIQIIRVLDPQNPVLDCPDNVTISTSGVDCNGTYRVPPPVVETSCTEYTYVVSSSGGLVTQIMDGSYVITGLEEGDFTIQYQVEDECGRYSECSFMLSVVDQVGPVAVCEDGLNISLDGNGVAVVPADEIDGLSGDLCGEVDLAVRRYYTFDSLTCAPLDVPYFNEWGDSIVVNCCDLLQTVRVELQVTDEDGNMSTCWTDVLIEDKIAPSCVAPEDVVITCTDYRDSLSADILQISDDELDLRFGAVGAVDNCSFVSEQAVSGSLDNCGVGRFIRTFTVTDGSGLVNTNECVQTIDVINVYDYQVTLPTDVSGTCADIPDYDELLSTDFACDLLTTSRKVDTLRTTEAGDECFKLQITYDIINWCEYNSLGEPYLLPRDGRTGRDPETEVLYLNVVPGTTTDSLTDDFAFLSRFADRNFDPGTPQSDYLIDDGDDTDGSDDNNQNPESLRYALDNSRGAFRYVQYIKVYDEVAPVITLNTPQDCFSGDAADCSATVDLDFMAEDNCSRVSVTAALDVDYTAGGFLATRPLTDAELFLDVTGVYRIKLEGVPVGQHAIRLRADDGCGNTDIDVLEFCVVAEKAPAPICIETLTVTLVADGNGGGTAAIWANDFVASPITDCFGNAITTYSLYSEEEAAMGGFTPENDHPGLTLTCSEFMSSGVAGYPVRLYAFDVADNSDYCQVFVQIQTADNDPCGATSMASIAGTIADPKSEAIEGVTVTLTGANGIDRELITAEDGKFRFSNLAPGEDYTLLPSHTHDYLNGVRTSDIVSITRHILGVSPLADPYKLLAADVDGNVSIDVGDIISIRRLILGLSEAFPAGQPSWIFIPADFSFDAPQDPWATPFPEVANYNDLVGNVTDADFVGVKLGDVNQSALANQLAAPAPRSHSGTLQLEMDEADLVAGNTYRIPVVAPQLDEVDGFQFTLEFDITALDLVDIKPGLLTAGHFGRAFANRGMLTTSWNWASATVPEQWSEGEVLFTLEVRAKADGKLSENLGVSSWYTAAEAYERNLSGVRDLALVFNEVVVETAENRLFQNVPNPIQRQTVIAYELAESHARVKIMIRDAAGRVVAELTQEGSEGYNSIVVDRRLLNGAAGVYSYTVTAGDWVATKRMILLR